MDESYSIIQDLQVSVSRAQQDKNYWEREARRWRVVAETYFKMWYNDISDNMLTLDTINHEMSMIYKELFESEEDGLQ